MPAFLPILARVAGSALGKSAGRAAAFEIGKNVMGKGSTESDASKQGNDMASQAAPDMNALSGVNLGTGVR